MFCVLIGGCLFVSLVCCLFLSVVGGFGCLVVLFCVVVWFVLLCYC